jgi:3-oxoacyl-[acyl-carrier-protein] synthase III
VAGIGILAVGTYLPPDIRRNDWWPAETVARWMEQRAAARAAAGPPPAAMTPGMARVIAAMAEQSDDPFQGWRERRVMPETMTSADMEEAAARDALERAGSDGAEIDLVLTQTMVPEVLLGNTACELHRRLGLAARCLSTQVDAAAFSFFVQLRIAEQMIAAGGARKALIVQSCAVTRLLDPADPISPFFGDGASAAVVGPVAADRGILGSVHKTDGRFPRTLVAGVPEGRWYDEGRPLLHTAAPGEVRQMLLEILDHGKHAVADALVASRCRTDEIDVFVSHQGMPWLRRSAQEYAGLGTARSIETGSWAGNLFSVNVPLGLATAEREGMLRAGEVVLAFGGGTGQTVGATVVRWGR